MRNQFSYVKVCYSPSSLLLVLTNYFLCSHGLHISGEERKPTMSKKILRMRGLSFGSAEVASHQLRMMLWTVISTYL